MIQIGDTEFNDPKIYEIFEISEIETFKLKDGNKVEKSVSLSEPVKTGYLFVEGKYKYFVSLVRLNPHIVNFMKGREIIKLNINI